MSKTVKRVSKTAKRVMTVTMIGLVAMLGAEAEAHTRWVNGKLRICSIEADATVEEMDLGQVALATLTVTAREVTITCDDETVELLRGKKNQATLIGESLAGPKISGTAILKFDISTKELFNTLGFCARSSVRDARVLQLDAGFELTECVGNVGNEPPDCSNRVLLSTMEYKNCEPDFKSPPDKEQCFPYKCKKGPILDEEAHPGPLAE